MRWLGPKSFPELCKIFDEENIVKDARCGSNSRDEWPRDRFDEANRQFGEWNEFELSHDELLNVKLIWNNCFEIPQAGMTVAEALRLARVRNWVAEGKGQDYRESHIWLANEPLTQSATREYELLEDYAGRLITLDGIHRLVAWAAAGKQATLAFVAGRYDRG